jgi:hypothetical protein
MPIGERKAMRENMVRLYKLQRLISEKLYARSRTQLTALPAPSNGTVDPGGTKEVLK